MTLWYLFKCPARAKSRLKNTQPEDKPHYVQMHTHRNPLSEQECTKN